MKLGNEIGGNFKKQKDKKILKKKNLIIIRFYGS